MATPSTFIKLDRNITKWRWYTNSNTLRVWIQLLLSANHARHEFENITIERGQLAATHESLANTLKLSVQEVRTALGHLKSTGEITATTHRRFQVISIVNYDLYQGSSTGKITGYQQPINNLSTGYQQQSKNNKEYIEHIKNEEEYIYAPTEPKKAVRHKYGEYKNVLLSDDELEKLKSEYPNDYEERIERLSEYIASTGKSYKSHLATIRSWAKKDKPKQEKRRICIDENEDTLDDLF